MTTAGSPGSTHADLGVGRFTIPVGCPVYDVDGRRVGRAADVIDDCLVVRHDAVYVDHLPFDVVAGFDGMAVRLAVTTDEIHTGDWQRTARAALDRSIDVRAPGAVSLARSPSLLTESRIADHRRLSCAAGDAAPEPPAFAEEDRCAG